MTSSKPTTRYQDIRHNVAKIKDYLARGGGLDNVLAEQSMAYDAIRMCFLEISEAAVKLGALAELHEPEIPWGAIRGFGNHLRIGLTGRSMPRMSRTATWTCLFPGWDSADFRSYSRARRPALQLPAEVVGQ